MGSSYNTQTRQSHDLFFVWSTPGRLARHINMLRTITEEPISNNSAADKKRTSMFRKFSCGGSKKRLSNEGQKLFCGNSDEPSTEVSVVKIKRLLYSIFYTHRMMPTSITYWSIAGKHLNIFSEMWKMNPRRLL